MILHKFYIYFVKFPICYYVIDFFEVVTDFLIVLFFLEELILPLI